MPAKKKSASSPADSTAPITEYKAQVPADDKKLGRVFLIDTFGFVFRAYHAMARQRPMSTKTGIPTSATYVFVNMLNKLRQDFAPEHIAAIMEGGKTFRDEEAAAVATINKFDIKTQTFQEIAYGGYKANRTEMPEDLTQQMPYIERALNAYRIPMISAEGFEADDVIGTLAKKAADGGYPVYIVSSDKDMMQLVTERVCILNPPKDNLICDPKKVEEILGVPPERVVDVMALRGDSIDNVPGAPGIGDKGSVQLIQRFGTVEAALDHAGEVESKRQRESLQQNRDAVLFSKRMVTIRTDIDMPFEPQAMRAQDPDYEACKALFAELEFNNLLKQFLTEGSEVGETDYADAKSTDEIKALLRDVNADHPLAVAIAHLDAPSLAAEEAEPEEDAPQLALAMAEPVATPQVTSVALSSREGAARAVELKGESGEVVRRALADPTVPKAVHDAKAAMHAGLPLESVEHDTMLYEYLLDPTYTTYRLPDVVLRRLNLKLAGTLPEAADMTHRLTTKLHKLVEDGGLMKVYEDIDRPLVTVLYAMEAAGVKLDCDVLAEMSTRLQRDADALARKIYGLSGQEFNINSPKQLGDVLFNKLNLPKPVKYGKGKTISTAVDVLEGLAGEHEVPKLVLEYRQFTKLKSTYVDALPNLCHAGTGRLHTTFAQAATSTGRLSSVNPNLQNIPIRTELGREIRAAFVAEKGNVLLAADYSQIELRLLAHFSQDRLLVDAYNNDRDIHALTASEVFGVPPMMIDAEHRRRAKAVNFGIVYGISPFGLSQQLGIDTKESKRYIESYFERYSGVREWLNSVLEQVRKDEKVSTLFGRIRPIPDIHSRNPNLRGFAERTATNTPLQGTAADLIKLAMIRIHRDLIERKLKTRMLLQVHDELVFEVPQAEVEEVRALVQDRMENVHPELTVPLKVDVGVGKNWRDMD
ncbi:DNA polymerase I [Candidatus Koribacter versatilis Ellin345]|uniref:DNA polymerase I n=1 Tax=Koribacter versatilis (strain Ellin345) TaxID=204669 RepID=Q1II21_KORVE|nr:DNA polymerase I [Candidatus Koribacter versatilis]ABF43479.1 DNA polymerase I [Candidatus Koribacter versatilis Ellin345]